jgi:hypothetical protein
MCHTGWKHTTVTLLWHTPKLFKWHNCGSNGKTMEEKKIGIYFLARSILGVEGRVRALGWGLGRVISGSIIHIDLHKPNISWLVCSWSIFGVWTSHGHTWIHKIHHSLDLGEVTTFPLIVLFVLGHEVCTQMSFCPEIHKSRVPKFPNWDFRKFGSP